ncbi:GH25 family lysozyme [Weissella minor]|uniref:GH25 family lysozyme n=1 Tax=Weissella minor TaxID=1620 RepID=UPI003AF27B48
MAQIKMYGVDVSSFQPGDINYIQSLYTAGARFLFSKATEGTVYVNPNFGNQILNADKVGMLTAGYHFSRFGGNETQAVKEGDFAVNTAKGILLPGSIIALDYEADASSSKSANTTAAKTFMRVIKNRGYVPMIYSYKPYFDKYIDLNSVIKEFGECVWIAGYPAPGSSIPNFNYFPSEPGVQIWQFDDNWKGMKVDGNVLIGDWLEKQVAKKEPKPMKRFKEGDKVCLTDKATHSAYGTEFTDAVKGTWGTVTQETAKKKYNSDYMYQVVMHYKNDQVIWTVLQQDLQDK